MSEPWSLQFLGAAGTVTGSKYLVRRGGDQFLLDAGLFQGPKQLRRRNWDQPPFDPAHVAAVVLSHAHIDHSGYLPLLARSGFRGAIHCAPGTADLLRVLLPDSAHLQEEEARYANRHGYSRHKPALPLYTAADAEVALGLLQPHAYFTEFEVVGGAAAQLRPAGHILGSASICLTLGGDAPCRLAFSGDLGRYGRPILRDPEPVSEADVLLVESTYGDRSHPPDPTDELARVVNSAAERGGALLVPAFAVGRTQELIWRLRQLEDAGRVPVLPVHVDSPMAIDVSALYCRHPDDHALEMTELMDAKRCPLCCKQYHLTRTPEESKALNQATGPLVIIAGSGMVTGGRILHHLKQRLPDPRTTVLLAGFQAAGTRGRSLQDRAKFVRIHGQDVRVRATVETTSGMSGHADREEIARWLAGFRRPPRQTYVVHGEPGPAQSLVDLVTARFGWPARVAIDAEVVLLGYG